MALDTQTDLVAYDAPEKDLYELGEMPPLGYVPKQMYAWAIRKERHGEPDTAMQVEIVETPEIDSNEVLVLVMAAGVNYNGVWASLGQPISPFDGHKAPYHIAGSDASGIIWKVGDKVKRWKVGDEVVIHCNQDDGDDEHCNGGDPMYSPSQRIWGYETPDGSFAQFTRVQAQQLMHRPKHLTWEEAACYTLTLATAYRMLFGHEPHDLKPGQNVLVWGASGGLGSYAIQLINTAGANAGANAAQDVAVTARDNTVTAAIAGSLAVGSVGLSGALDLGIFKNTTAAYIGDNVTLNARRDLFVSGLANRAGNSFVLGAGGVATAASLACGGALIVLARGEDDDPEVPRLEALQRERRETADCREARQHNRQEPHLACPADGLVQRHTLAPELVREVHQQDRVLDLDADQGDEADGRGE